MEIQENESTDFSYENITLSSSPSESEQESNKTVSDSDVINITDDEEETNKY